MIEEINEIIKNIKDISIFNNLNEIEIRELLNYAVYEEYKENQIIFNENDPGSSLYIVLEGEVKIYRFLTDNTLHEISNFGAKEIFGEMSFMDHHVRSANAQAIKNTKLIKISSSDFEKFSKYFPDAAFRFHKNIITAIQERLRRTNDRYLYHSIWGKVMKTALAKSYEELLQSNLELVSTRNFLSKIINNSNDIIIVLNNQLKLIMMNNGCEKILGISFTDYANQSIEKLFYDKENFEIFKATITTLAENENKSIEIAFKNKDGVKLITYASIFKLTNDNTNSNLNSDIAIIAKDITQKKILELQILQNEKMIFLGKAISEIVHDIKTPLTIIQLTNDSLKLKIDDLKIDYKLKNELNDNIIKINEAIEKIHNIIQNTLSYVKVLPSQKSIIELKEIILKTIEFINLKIKNKNLKININFKDNLKSSKILGNSSQIEQLLINIINNSIEAIEEKNIIGNIDIQFLDKEDNYIYVSIKDNGCGIPENVLPHIFEPFFTTKNKTYNGNGLGLSICQTIISQHNGKILVNSIQNVGTEFILQFPKINN